jgi:hypothetical protein
MLHENTLGMVIILQRIVKGIRATYSYQSCNRFVRSMIEGLPIETDEAVGIQWVDSLYEKYA